VKDQNIPQDWIKKVVDAQKECDPFPNPRFLGQMAAFRLGMEYQMELTHEADELRRKRFDKEIKKVTKTLRSFMNETKE